MLWKSARQKRILHASYVECPNCKSVELVSKWNQLAQDTYGSHSPDIRNAAVKKGNSFPFQCPSCFKGYSAKKMNFSDGKDTSTSTSQLKPSETT
ncbi:hypothetical protein ACM26V_14125 [Salipaludibacillus sp. HK11]|uniref:hypothetical protein n=1 Tax=Salipaludibacillus sp. HK11 TaxID=3394320 RepID=UPI0039FD87AD